jgi:hypothetical protein
MTITLGLGRLSFSFSTTTELRDALLASFPDADYAGGPFVMVNQDEAALAWGWVVDLVRQRTDWREGLGIAIQHAAHDGGDLARTALADLTANFKESLTLLEWTSPLARRWPDVKATRCATGWGGNVINPRLSDVVTEQQAQWRSVGSGSKAFLDEFGAKGAPVTGKLSDTRDLQALLTETAKHGRFPDGKGPWSWVANELLYRTWMPAALVPAMTAAVAAGGDAEIHALLDWMSEECDLWRFVSLLDGWNNTPPPWWSRSADSKPSGWQQAIRAADWSGASTLGDVGKQLLARAQAQAATPPRVDLQPRP